jgi:mRNA interferase HicA
MKKRDLEKKIGKYGWVFLRRGGKHDIWTNGEFTEPIPRHRTIPKRLANKIIALAKANPSKNL